MPALQAVDLRVDASYLGGGIEFIVGVDEAGRGCLAGPLFAAAVFFEPLEAAPPVQDSKRLSEELRWEVAESVRAAAAAWACVSVSPREIDRRGIDWANRIAFSRALRALLKSRPEIKGRALALIDGNRSALRPPLPQRTLVRGDQLSPSVAAASILAKTERDRFMIEVLHRRHPEYGFAQHKGYGTPAHREAILRLGPTPAHRRSFSWGAPPGSAASDKPGRSIKSLRNRRR